jgi:hypothetical protein
MIFTVMGWLAAIAIFGYLPFVVMLRTNRAPWERYIDYAVYLFLLIWLVSLVLLKFVMR